MPPGQSCKTRPDAQPGPKGRDETDTSVKRGRDPMWLCAHCRHEITARSQATDKMGAHCHTRVNPHGYVFRIGCFATAPGCHCEGPDSGQWSWFPGYRWQIAQCAACTVHLGWRFTTSIESFFGLILDHLVLGEDKA